VELHGEAAVVIGVTLAKRHPAGKLLRELVHDRGYPPTGPAPFRPEIHHHKGVGSDELLEMHLVDILYPAFSRLVHLPGHLLYPLLPNPLDLLIHVSQYTGAFHLILAKPPMVA